VKLWSPFVLLSGVSQGVPPLWASNKRQTIFELNVAIYRKRCRRYVQSQIKSSQVYFFNSRIKSTAKLHNTKLYSGIYTQQNYKIKSTTKYTQKVKKTYLLIQSIANLTENTELKMKNVFVLVAGRGYMAADRNLEVVLSLCEGNRERMQEEGWEIDLKNRLLASSQSPLMTNRSRIWAFDWHQDWWCWMTVNCYKFKSSVNFDGFRRFGRREQLNEWR